jgi:N-acetylglucosaminyl-diphospho-decaprenol L-rhamnosyltransferase
MPSPVVVYIPTLRAGARLGETLDRLSEQTQPVETVVIANGTADEELRQGCGGHPQVEIVRLERNIGFGAAINHAFRMRPAERLILLNDDASPTPRFLEEMLARSEQAEMVAGVLLQEKRPEVIDSAGVIADRSLMAFDYLNGERADAALRAEDPLGPCGGAALYAGDAFDAVGGFDERIFAYYEDLDLALRLRRAGAICRLAPNATAIHSYSKTLGSGSAAKYELTGWARGYLLRRYGVMRKPRLAVHALLCEAAICGGQMAMDRTARGLRGRVQGWRAGGSLPRRSVAGPGLMKPRTLDALLRRGRRRR